VTRESFADLPPMTGERRADKHENATLWTVREALLSTLRDLDGGELEPTDVVICLREQAGGGHSRTRFRCAGPGGCLVALGLLARTAFLINRGY
jgi:hypothetical protein